MASAELELRQFLSNALTPEELLRKLKKRIGDVSISWEDRRFYWYYLFNAGYFQEVWELIKEKLEQKDRIPFDLLIEIATRSKLTVQASVVESLLKGLKKQNALEDLLTATGFDKWDDRFEEMRGLVSQQQTEKQEKVRRELVEKFEFLQNERMTQQAADVLAQLRKLYPEDPMFEQLELNFKQQWARDLVSARSSLPEEIETREPPKVPVSPEDEAMLEAFLKEVKKKAKKSAHIAYDMAVGGWFLEEYNFALSCLELAPDSIQGDWLRCELLLASRRYVECLDQLAQVEVKYATDPETTFGASYLRALALKKLGRHDQALEILRSIVHIRPNYRSAQSLITEWDKSVRAR